MKKLISVLFTVAILMSGLSVSAISQEEAQYTCKELPENVQGPEEYCGQELIMFKQGPEEYNGQPLKNFNDR